MKRLLLTTVLCALATSAFADPIFDTNTQFTANGTNSPGSFSGPANTGGGSFLNGGNLFLTTTIFPTGLPSGAEWIVFQYQSTVEGVPLSTPSVDWAINQVGIPTLVATNFIADFTQFTDSGGDPFNQTVSIFGQALENSPLSFLSGNGEGTNGFVAPFPAGPLPSLGAFSDPFSVVTNALGTDQVFGFTQALEFEPQVVEGVPEPRTWVMGLLGFGLLAAMGWRRSRAARYAI